MDRLDEIWSGWEIEKELGAGSFGIVYRVRREWQGHISHAAVKVLHIPQNPADIRDLKNSGMDENSVRTYYQEMVDNLMNEISIMESLKSAGNIVSIEDFAVREDEGAIGWTIYIRMELLTDLGSYLASVNRMTMDEVVRLGCDICNALICCEKKHIMHRDIKIDNIFINEFGSFKLGDFGISRQLERTTSALSRKGTNMYMAPEVSRGEEYGGTVDIYSLGILLYRLLNEGKFPFVPTEREIRYSDTQVALKKRLVGETPEKPLHSDDALWEIIKKASAYQSEDRYQTAEEMLSALEEYRKQRGSELQEEVIRLSGESSSFTSDGTDPSTMTEAAIDNAYSKTPSAVEKKKEGRSRRRLWIGLAGVVTLLILIAVLYPLWSGLFHDASDSLLETITTKEAAYGASVTGASVTGGAVTDEPRDDGETELGERNKKADKALLKKIKKHKDIFYMLSDLTGDDVHEAVSLVYNEKSKTCDFHMYSYSEGKVTELIYEDVFMAYPDEIQLYEKSRAFVLVMFDDDGTEYYYYFDKLGTEYMLFAYRIGFEFGSDWEYYVDEEKVEKSDFKKAIDYLQDENPIILKDWEGSEELAI